MWLGYLYLCEVVNRTILRDIFNEMHAVDTDVECCPEVVDLVRVESGWVVPDSTTARSSTESNVDDLRQIRPRGCDGQWTCVRRIWQDHARLERRCDLVMLTMDTGSGESGRAHPDSSDQGFVCQSNLARSIQIRRTEVTPQREREVENGWALPDSAQTCL